MSVALLVLVAGLLTAPRPWQLVTAGALVAVSFGLKETTFIFGAVGAVFLVAVGIRALSSASSASRGALVRIGALGRLPWMWSLMAFLALFLVIFTSGLRYAAGFESGLLDGIRYWLGQHGVGRGSQRWFFYAVVYLAYEWLVLALAAGGLVVTVRRRSIVGAWFATMALGQFAVYTWAGEKFAWLAIHPLLPTILLGGLGAQAVADRVRAPSRRRLVAVALGVAAAGTLLVAIRPAITDGDDPRELLVTVQTSRAVPAINDRLRDGKETGEIERILVDQRDSGSWPWAWYLHDLDGVEYITLDPSQPLPAGYDAYLVSASADPPAVPDGYEITRFPLRRWWLPDYGSASIGDDRDVARHAGAVERPRPQRPVPDHPDRLTAMQSTSTAPIQSRPDSNTTSTQGCDRSARSEAAVASGRSWVPKTTSSIP